MTVWLDYELSEREETSPKLLAQVQGWGQQNREKRF